MFIKLTLIYLIFHFFTAKSEKLIKLIDLLDSDSYIPVKRGQIFIIEIEGNPSEGKVWTVDDPKRLISSNLINPLNLDDNNSSPFYNSEVQSDFANGFYHFKFKSSKRNFGHEQITFVYKNKDRIIKKTINIHIINQPRMDL